MSGRGVLTVQDLRSRSLVDINTGCWHWLGAKATDGTPRIWTFDHERNEKRGMSGAKAVWNIAHGEAPRAGWLVYRRCLNTACVCPVHMAQARDKAEIGLHIHRAKKRVGTNLEQRRAAAAKGVAAQNMTVTPDHIVLEIRSAPASVTTRELAARLGKRESCVGAIRTGKRRGCVLPAKEAA